ncbi:tRNA preQ1(34) S-adenosylmethionine ribosyltransferase-isomerase QueA [Candidatus Magnetaquicoccus inordinatus]|uniref:tRNA preQ1(34) S-adenosylmethionine ribosyltransferase-isomerase QueA n=1 Tax=Candidatus Magnetaquicoccus inordinatus TaxID=2496818 RepID=UPI00102B4FD5|nr:tRNA preQ1(34) S-adenosylmethionine ribosyltransferase-isomerase QueA [Candidatus Magnetaquicoccus inordinatus]
MAEIPLTSPSLPQYPSTAWRLSHFDYHLPAERIAQQPATIRDRSRLLVSLPQQRYDQVFRNLPEWLRPGDLLVMNDTRVIPARLLANKPSGGRIEILLLHPLDNAGAWQAMATGSKRIHPGLQIPIAPGLTVLFVERNQEGFRVQIESNGETVLQALQRHGHLPLPPYITGSSAAQDQQRYQTIYARQPGAVAAPTAGLHFTSSLLARLRAQGVRTTTVTLHVGPGTFQPVREEEIHRHVMHREQAILSPHAARLINQTHAQQGRVVAVGTTSLRVLESAALPSGRVRPWQGETGLFIVPGYRFRTVDALITNFHLPRSTLLMLVAALIGKRRLDRDYAHAINHGYRFYSYGDAMLLFPETKR